MSVKVPWITGAAIKEFATDIKTSEVLDDFDSFGSYPVTYMDSEYCTRDHVRIQVMRGGRSVTMRIPTALYRALRNGEYVCDEG